MPLLLWPFPSGVAPPPIRTPDGKVFILDERLNLLFGPSPEIDESCVMVLNVGPGPTLGANVRVFFTSPLGVLQEGDSSFAFVTPQTIAENFPNLGFPRGETFTYTIGTGELPIAGLWQVYVLSNNFQTRPVTFRVNLPDTESDDPDGPPNENDP